jgi:hypothetical protein
MVVLNKKRTKMKTTTFATIALGQFFTCNGTTFVKASTRTATILYNQRTFYFGMDELCAVVE